MFPQSAKEKAYLGMNLVSYTAVLGQYMGAYVIGRQQSRALESQIITKPQNAEHIGKFIHETIPDFILNITHCFEHICIQFFIICFNLA